MLLRDAAAVSKFGQIGMPYVDGFGEVTFAKVTIEKPDGRRIDATNGPVESINPFGVTESSLAADIRFKKLTVPSLEPGDRLSYRIALRQRPLAPGRICGEMKFPWMIGDPAQTYELDLPRAAGVAVELRNDLGVVWEEIPGPPELLPPHELLYRLRLAGSDAAFSSKRLAKTNACMYSYYLTI